MNSTNDNIFIQIDYSSFHIAICPVSPSELERLKALEKSLSVNSYVPKISESDLELFCNIYYRVKQTISSKYNDMIESIIKNGKEPSSHEIIQQYNKEFTDEEKTRFVNSGYSWGDIIEDLKPNDYTFKYLHTDGTIKEIKADIFHPRIRNKHNINLIHIYELQFPYNMFAELDCLLESNISVKCDETKDEYELELYQLMEILKIGGKILYSEDEDLVGDVDIEDQYEYIVNALTINNLNAKQISSILISLRSYNAYNMTIDSYVSQKFDYILEQGTDPDDAAKYISTLRKDIETKYNELDRLYPCPQDHFERESIIEHFGFNFSEHFEDPDLSDIKTKTVENDDDDDDDDDDKKLPKVSATFDELVEMFHKNNKTIIGTLYDDNVYAVQVKDKYFTMIQDETWIKRYETKKDDPNYHETDAYEYLTDEYGIIDTNQYVDYEAIEFDSIDDIVKTLESMKKHILEYHPDSNA